MYSEKSIQRSWRANGLRHRVGLDKFTRETRAIDSVFLLKLEQMLAARSYSCLLSNLQ